ncbi:UDP-N-acetylmuramoyl-tripeptide--D-alanyl-D-alanine ligase [Hahella ganghwensis]|uniref:UDP-N-acetylmuramoyl-tripeptide--D-alanyl-D- alanine ligase n=1 Tax=Hahella ganghwensis TaxID=286420 RepID=UPI0003A72B02|nr:UDP-N-acetylmuramoyl-tripeptide--D-alanyl-D-alanine ligase [Hahella ganghwensis]
MIGTWTSQDIAVCCQGEHKGPVVDIADVVTDSRKDCAGALFVALSGERFDAHDFVEDVVAKGAQALMVERPLALSTTQVIVPDTTKGLGHVGAANRARFNGPVVAITGSVGKTTVKEMLASIFGQAATVCKTEGNLNNHFGVPISLMRLSDEHQAAVFELGASGVGEIAYTVSLVKPQVAILNNAVASHLEGFGSLENIVRAKGEIIEGLPEDGIAVLNADDPNFECWLAMAGKRRVISFGLCETANVYARQLKLEAEFSVFELVTPSGTMKVRLPFSGEHSVKNALAAAAAALGAGVSVSQIVAGLENAPAVKGRMNRKVAPNGVTVLDDTYNANPTSMMAALDVLVRYPGRHIAVLGYMGELGEEVDEAHRKVGEYARSIGVEQCYVTGTSAESYRQGFGDHTFVGRGNSEVIAELKRNIRAGDVVLLKGSRSARMEEVVEALMSGQS